MIFPNAYTGVKKLFASQILHILSTVFFFVSAVWLAASPEPEGDALDYVAWITIGTSLAGVVMGVIAFLLQLVGLNQARRDERLFKKAMYFVIVCAACTIALLFGRGMFSRIASGVDEISTLLIYVYIFISVFNLAEQLGNTSVQKRGKLALLFVTVLFGAAFLINIFVAFIPEQVDIVENLSVISTICEFIGYIVALLYIGTARRMLAKAQRGVLS